MADGDRNRTRTLRVDALARVEGEGALLIELRGDRAERVELRIFEPPRLFEAFLRGRSALELPDLTARICGICPVAYQMSSCHAVEDALGIRVDGALRELRRLLYCGEWIESHGLHVFMLHLPDFLGYPDALAMARDHGELLRTALRIKKAGNSIVARLGGREIHPVNVRVGGFYRAPARAELEALLPELAWSATALEGLVPFLAGLSFPDVQRDVEMVALRHPDEYPFCEGRIVSSRGLDISISEFPEHFVEEQVPYSTALQARRRLAGAYVSGPLARVNLNHDRLCPEAQKAAERMGLTPPCLNPYRSLQARVVELIQAVAEARRVITSYRPPPQPFVVAEPRAATGHGATCAPRGLLYHRYTVDECGLVRDAVIVPPTTQNHRAIEEDLRAQAPDLARLSHEAATARAEQAVRNYDPCISCSTHFLKLTLVQK
jgi:coenzyme F420-reducing hydrogenase alpha subunit